MSEKILKLPERFDFDYQNEFIEQYQIQLTDKSVTEITIDFSRVAYLDGSALGMLVLFQKKAKSLDIPVQIKGAKDSAKEILQIANIDRLFDIV